MSRAHYLFAVGLALLVVAAGCRKRASPSAPAPSAEAASVSANFTPVTPTEPHLVQTLQQVNEAVQAHVKSGKPAPRTLEELNALRITEFIPPAPAGRAWHIDAAGRFLLVAK